MRISPNPTTGRIHIETSEAIKSVRVYSVSGSLVAEGFNADMDLSRLPNGIYIVKVNNFNGVRIIKR
ncbi:MAG: T9SS type A sorting domain-containing protein [Prevotella buccalis]|nr:T9SS type A sorting domain-containing protein [Hoylesella buccalis]